MLAVSSDEKINYKIVTIKNQELNIGEIMADSASQVINNKTISSIINISEEPFIIDQLTISNIEWEPYEEQVLTITNSDENDGHRRIKTLTYSGLYLDRAYEAFCSEWQFFKSLKR